MHEARTSQEVAALLRSFYKADLSGIIAIDGKDGTGKTTLANDLQRTIGGQVISLDRFLVENRGGYVPNLKQDEIEAALRLDIHPKIVEGVCLLSALDSIARKPDVLIYIKRVDSWDCWLDEGECDPTEPVEDLIARRTDEVAIFSRHFADLSGKPDPGTDNLSLSPLREEILRYHARYRPSRRAQIVFLKCQ